MARMFCTKEQARSSLRLVSAILIGFGLLYVLSPDLLFYQEYSRAQLAIAAGVFLGFGVYGFFR